jgi:hypothetical protein
MASGPEMMMQALLKAMGFNPQQFVRDIEGFIGQINRQMDAFSKSALSINQRLEQQGKSLVELHAKSDLILAYLEGRVINERPHIEFNGNSNGINGVQHSIDGNNLQPAGQHLYGNERWGSNGAAQRGDAGETSPGNGPGIIDPG